MALVFTVSTPRAKFDEPCASQFTEILKKIYDSAIDFDQDFERDSEELGWSGWRKLQERGIAACGKEKIPHFLSMEAWFGCYLPLKIEIGSIKFPGEPSKIEIGSLENLIAELEMIGLNSSLPIDDDSLDELFNKYMDDDDLIDEDMDVQTFTQLLPLARLAMEKKLPLWIVK